MRLDPGRHESLTRGVGSRLGIPEYAMALAHVASLRSEDPYRKVGAAALDGDNRVIGTAYNGLAPGFDPPPGFWDDRATRQKPTQWQSLHQQPYYPLPA